MKRIRLFKNGRYYELNISRKEQNPFECIYTLYDLTTEPLFVGKCISNDQKTALDYLLKRA